jgi:recombination associated protein RdgC
MWFRQTKFYQLSNKIDNTETLSTALSDFAFEPCPPSFAITQGWTGPIYQEAGEPLIHSIPGYMIFCLQFEEKLLPMTVVRQAVKDKIREIEVKEDRKVRAKEKQQLNEEMRHSLLPKAFSKFSRVHAIIDIKQQLLMVNATQEKKLESFLTLFNRSVKTTEAKEIPIKTVMPILTDWLIKNNHPSTFAIEKNAVLQDPNYQQRVVRCQQQDLSANSIQTLLSEGCAVKQLTLSWHDQIIFSLHDDFTLRSIKYQDELVEAAKEINVESDAQRFDADFLIMAESLHNLTRELLPYFAEMDSAKAEAAEAETILA